MAEILDYRQGHMKEYQEKKAMSEKGFTLIELVVAILVFAIGILGIAKMQTLSVKGTSYGMHYSQALNMAQDKIEELKPLSMTACNTFNVGAPSIAEYTKKAPAGTIADDTVYTIRYDVTRVASSDTREVQMTVSWNETFYTPKVVIKFIKR